MATAETKLTYRATVEQYLEAVSSGTATEIAALYAEDATVEDPAGSPPIKGTKAISAFYENTVALDCTTTLLTYREGGRTAAFHFRVTIKTPDSTAVITPIDVMTFDENGKITSMIAIFSDSDYEIS
jgi:steroid delta-isomerase